MHGELPVSIIDNLVNTIKEVGKVRKITGNDARLI
jgi:hypothetical protein